MRIGIDVTSWANERGYGRFLRELLPELIAVAAGSHEMLLYADSGVAESLRAKLPEAMSNDVTIRTVEVDVAPTAAATSESRRTIRDMRRFTKAVAKDRPDVLFYPTVYTYFPAPRGQRTLLTIHDTIPEQRPKQALGGRKAQFFWRLKMRHALKRASLVLTVSETSRENIVEWLEVADEKIRVAIEAPSPVFRPWPNADEIEAAARAVGVPRGRRWCTYVGGFNAHKLVDVLISVHAEVCGHHADPPHLLLIGAVDSAGFTSEFEELREWVEVCESEDYVHFTGFLPDEDVIKLHTGAVACFLLSEVEGFGLPAVEAAACGTPSIVTRHSPLPEILEDGCFPCFPFDTTEAAQALSRLLNEPELRERMGRVALERASSLSWKSTATATLSAIEEAATT